MRTLIVLICAVSICFDSFSAHRIEPRIVDGRASGPNEFPFYVYLDVIGFDGIHSSCAATIISKDWLLSAGHCIINAESVNVHFGEYLINRPKPGHTPILVQSDAFFIHPSYPQNDIGIC